VFKPHLLQIWAILQLSPNARDIHLLIQEQMCHPTHPLVGGQIIDYSYVNPFQMEKITGFKDMKNR
jgi:hypothetical protein